jgi:Tol biopolymer transport system component
VPEAGQNVQFPAVAPRGKRLAYERINSDANVWLYALPGESTQPPLKVSASTQMEVSPQISPDGNRIVFASNRTGGREIWVCNRDGSNLVQLTSFGSAGAGSPRWSPDGRRIAFDAALRGNVDIFVIDAQGGTPRPLTTAYEGEDSRPSWSNDGRWIYFASNRSGTMQIWKQSPDGGEPVQVTQGGGVTPFESPDGRFLYFARAFGDAGVWRVPVEGGQEVAVLGAAKVWEQGWAVGESGLYFTEYRQASALTSRWFLRWLPFDVAEPLDVMELPPPSGPAHLDIAPDGKWFAYAQSEQVGSDLMLLENFE